MSRRPPSRSRPPGGASPPPRDELGSEETTGAGQIPPPPKPPDVRRSAFSVEIRGPVGRAEGTDTDVDADDKKKRRLKKKRRRSEAPPPPPPAGDPDSEATPIAAPPALVESARLSALRLHESAGRRHAATPKRRLPTEPSANLPRVRIGWVRSEDTGQRLLPYKRHGFIVEGLASGVHSDDRRRSAGSGGALSRGPALAIGIEGQIFSVRVDGGETPLETAERFIQRLQAQFEVSLVDQEGVRALVRVLRERPRRGPIT